MEQFTWFRLNADQRRELFLELVIHPPQEIRHPANASFSQDDFEFRVGFERSTEDDLTQRFVELHRHRRHKRGDLAAAGIGWPGAADTTAKVKAERNAGLSSHSPHGLPIFMKNRLDRVKHTEQRSLETQFGNPLEFFG